MNEVFFKCTGLDDIGISYSGKMLTNNIKVPIPNKFGLRLYNMPCLLYVVFETTLSKCLFCRPDLSRLIYLRKAVVVV